MNNYVAGNCKAKAERSFIHGVMENINFTPCSRKSGKERNRIKSRRMKEILESRRVLA
jgi:hypothetical protein